MSDPKDLRSDARLAPVRSAARVLNEGPLSSGTDMNEVMWDLKPHRGLYHEDERRFNMAYPDFARSMDAVFPRA